MWRGGSGGCGGKSRDDFEDRIGRIFGLKGWPISAATLVFLLHKSYEGYRGGYARLYQKRRPKYYPQVHKASVQDVLCAVGAAWL